MKMMNNTEYVKVVDKIIEILDAQREEMEKDMEEFMGNPKEYYYPLEEQRYDEGYTNALLWASLTIAKEMYKGVLHD